MPKVTVNREQPQEPPITSVTLELSEDEAVGLVALLGHMVGPGTDRYSTEPVWTALRQELDYTPDNYGDHPHAQQQARAQLPSS